MLFAIYLSTALFGGVLTLISLFSGSEDADGADSSGADADGAEGDASGAEGSIEAADDASVELPGTRKARSPFLSLRNVSASTLSFGAGGLLLGLTGLPAPLVLLVSVTLGLASWVLSWGILKALLAGQSTSLRNFADLAGREAFVLVPCTKQQKGKVQVEYLEGTLPLAALLAPWSKLDQAEAGSNLVVAGFDDAYQTVLLASDNDLHPEEDNGSH